jgi:hypothetical protein
MVYGIIPPQENPLDSINPNEILQLIERLLPLHPLSLIASRTMLLPEYRNKVHDQIVLSIIISRALHINCDHGPPHSTAMR